MYRHLKPMLAECLKTLLPYRRKITMRQSRELSERQIVSLCQYYLTYVVILC